MASDLQTITSDPDFLKLSDQDKATVIGKVDPTFTQMAPVDQAAILSHFSGGNVRSQIAARAVNPPPNALGDAVAKPTFLEQQGSEIGDVGVGLAKSAANTVYNLGKLAHHLPGMDTIAPDQTGVFDSTPKEIQPTNTAQRIGRGVGDVGQFFIPGAAEAGVLAPVAGALTGAGLLGSMLTEGATGAGVAAAQGDSPVAGALGGAVGPVVGKVAEKAAPALINSFLNVPAKAFKTGADAGAGVVDNGIMGNLSRWLTTANAQKSRVGQAISATLNTPEAASKTIDLMPLIMKPITDIAPARTVAGMTQRPVEGVANGILEQLLADGVNPSAATPAQAHDLQKLFDQGSRFDVEELPTSVKDVIKNIRRGVSDAISDAVPGVKPLKAQYANLAEASKNIQNRIESGHGLKETLKNPMAYLAPLVGFKAGGVKGAVAAGVGEAALNNAPVVGAIAQGLRGIGSPTGTSVTSKLGAAGLSSAFPEDDPMQQALAQYGSRPWASLTKSE